MTAVMTRSSLPINSQHISHSLLFQFVLVEFFQAHKQLQIMEPLLPSSLDRKMAKGIPHAHLPALIQGFTLLSGSSQGYVRDFSWNNEWGILTKLNHYFFLFVRNKITEYDTLLPLQNDLHKALLAALQCRDFLRFVQEHEQENHVTTTTLRYTTFFRNIIHIHTTFAKLARTVTHTIPQFHEDENLLFFLIRHQTEFNDTYEGGFLLNLLKSLFPGGLKQLETFLFTKYTARSFHHLLPIISEKLVQLTQSS